MKRFLKLLLILLIPEMISAQQIPQFSQRMIDIYQYNPACYGSKKYTEFLLHYRNQWNGFEGSPKTQTFSYQSRINRLMGIGIVAMKDALGPQKTVGIKLAYAHHIEFSSFNMSLGLSGDILQYGIDGASLTIQNPNDNSISLAVADKDWRPDASFGTFVYNEKFYFGFSILNLLGSTAKLFIDDGREGIINLARHFYFTGGYFFSPIRDFDFEPSVLWSFTKGSPMQLDINFNTQYKQMFLLGASYRLKDAIVLVAGIRIKNRLKLAYSYDIVTSSLRAYNSGSHEIILSFIIPSKRGKWNRWKHEYRYDFDPKTNKWRERW